MADHAPYPGIPRWVKIFGIVGIVVVLLAVIIILAGVGGEHGPVRHVPSSSVTEHGVQQP